ncbi:MAG: hypothetical protein WBZ36_03925 [Candidatus Nitrosopolaris sp.]
MLKQQQQKTEDNDNHKDKKPKKRWGIDNPGRDALVAMLLGDDPESIVNALLEELRQGKTEEELASVVCYASALSSIHVMNLVTGTLHYTHLHSRMRYIKV